MGMNDGGRESSHRCQVMSRSSDTQINLTKTYYGISACAVALHAMLDSIYGQKLRWSGIEVWDSGAENLDQQSLGSPDPRKVIDSVFHSSVSLFLSLFLTTLLYWMLPQCKLHQHRLLLPPKCGQVGVGHCCALDPPNGYHPVPISRGTLSLPEYLHGMIVLCIISCLSFPFLSYSICTLDGLHLKTGIM